MKIMRGTFAPISVNYSDELKSLILSMLHLDPNKRPTINQIMARPILINALMYLHTDMGMLKCTRLVFWFIADLKSYDYDQLLNKPSYFELIVIQQL